MASAQRDPFSDLETVIEETFERETADARAKKVEGLKHLHALRERFGSNGASSNPVQAVLPGVSTPSAGGDVSLKAAMIQAIEVISEPITRRSVLKWAYEKYPKLSGSKDGTVASTFSRVKSEFLEPAPGDKKFIFQRKVKTPAVTQTS